MVPNGVARGHGRPGQPGRPFWPARGLAGRPYVLWVGSLEPRKGVGTLVAAMARLRRRQPRSGARPRDVQLVLAGYPGWLTRDLLPAADAAALGSALHQLGQVERGGAVVAVRRGHACSPSRAGTRGSGCRSSRP